MCISTFDDGQLDEKLITVALNVRF